MREITKETTKELTKFLITCLIVISTSLLAWSLISVDNPIGVILLLIVIIYSAIALNRILPDKQIAINGK